MSTFNSEDKATNSMKFQQVLNNLALDTIIYKNRYANDKLSTSSGEVNIYPRTGTHWI